MSPDPTCRISERWSVPTWSAVSFAAFSSLWLASSNPTVHVIGGLPVAVTYDPLSGSPPILGNAHEVHVGRSHLVEEIARHHERPGASTSDPPAQMHPARGRRIGDNARVRFAALVADLRGQALREIACGTAIRSDVVDGVEGEPREFEQGNANPHRRTLLIDADGHSVRFGETIDDWQAEDFAALDPASCRRSRTNCTRSNGEFQVQELSTPC